MVFEMLLVSTMALTAGSLVGTKALTTSMSTVPLQYVRYTRTRSWPQMSELPLPSLVVLDLDMCVWTPEMYELYEIPTADKVTRGDLNGRGEGITGVYSGNRVIRMFPGALVALQESHDRVHEGLKLAVASSADTPLAERIGRAAMKILEVVSFCSVIKLGLTHSTVLRADILCN